MYLVKLYSNKDSFKTIEFKPNTINVILGKKMSSDTGKSVNGVGKTLSLKIIDFCLGASVNAKSELKKLEGWQFFLEFYHQNSKYTIQRDIDNSNIVYLNGDELKLKDFNKYMENLIFNIENKTSALSYRNLISRFVRIPKEGYNTWNICKKDESQESALINNALLLGVDTVLIDNKSYIKDQINLLLKNKKTIKEDENIKDIIKGADIGVNIASLTVEIEKIKGKIKKFKISEEYNNIKEDLEFSKLTKNKIINKIASLKNILENIEKSLEVKIDVSSEEVLNLYEQANVIFESAIKKDIEEVSEFHNQLLRNRQKRLREDRMRIQEDINELTKSLVIINNRIDDNFSYLENKGTLSEYDSLRSKLSDMELKLYKCKEYDNILSEIDIKIEKLKKDMAEESLKAAEYIRSFKEKEILSDMFKEFTDFIYQDEGRVSGIKFINNTGNNKLRFDIEPEINGQNSAGINNVKTLCMDMLYLKLKKNHEMEFIYHDNTIFTETDPRQVYNILKLAKNLCEEKSVQYIINLNYDMLNSVLEVSHENEDLEFEGFINDSIRVSLCDDDPKNKLLGIDIK